MAPRALGLSRVDRERRLTSKHVLAMSDGIEMRRIDARMNPAQMVKRLGVVELPDQLLISPAMSAMVLMQAVGDDIELAVSVAVQATDPQPAAANAFTVDLRPPSFDGRAPAAIEGCLRRVAGAVPAVVVLLAPSA